MGILIVLGLGVVVWKVIDLAKQKAAREKQAAMQTEQPFVSQASNPVSFESFSVDLHLESGENIQDTSATSGGLWLRIGKNGETSRLILVDLSGKIIGNIHIKQDHEKAISAN